MSYYDIRQKTEMLGCGAEKEYRVVKLEVNHRETCLYGDIKKKCKAKTMVLELKKFTIKPYLQIIIISVLMFMQRMCAALDFGFSCCYSYVCFDIPFEGSSSCLLLLLC